MVTSTVSANPFSITPLSNITPFTYRDGMTYLQVLRQLQCIINDELVPQLSLKLQQIIDEAKDVQERYQQGLDEFIATVEARFAELAESAAKVAVDNYLADPGTLDNATAAKITDAETAIRAALDGLYLPLGYKDTVDGQIAALTADLNTSVNSAVQSLAASINTVNGVLDGRLSPSNTTDYYLDLRLLGAVGDGVADDTTVLQSAFDAVRDGSTFRKAGMGRVVGTPGAVYKVTAELVVYRNTIFEGNGATIRRHHDGYLLMNAKRIDVHERYEGNGNIHLMDLVLDHNGSEFTGTGSTICFAHAENITLERVTVRDATSHGYEMNSSRNVRILNCHFEGYRAASPNTYVEAVQLDQATPWGFPAFGAYDYTGTHGVRIIGCTFGPSAKNPSHPRAIGSHGSIVDRPVYDVVIDGCVFSMSDCSIRMYNWNDTLVVNCYSTSVGGLCVINTTIPGDGTGNNTLNSSGAQTSASVACQGLRFINNTSTQGQGIRLVGQSSGRVRQTLIKGNRFDGGSSTGELECIWGYYFDGCTIVDNEINGYNIGIGFYAQSSIEYRLTASNNGIRYCGGHGMYLSGVEGAVITGNQTYNCGYNSDLGSHMRIAGSSKNASVNGNVGQTNGSTWIGKYGLYIASTVTGVSNGGNVMSGAGSVNGIADGSGSTQYGNVA